MWALLIQMAFAEKKDFHVDAIVCSFLSHIFSLPTLTYPTLSAAIVRIELQLFSERTQSQKNHFFFVSKNHTCEYLHPIGAESDWKNIFLVQRMCASFNDTLHKITFVRFHFSCRLSIFILFLLLISLFGALRESIAGTEWMWIVLRTQNPLDEWMRCWYWLHSIDLIVALIHVRSSFRSVSIMDFIYVDFLSW